MAEFDSAIPPGGTGRIVARVDTSKFEGARTKTIAVRSNDPQTPELVLRLSFDARPPVLVLPARRARLRTIQGQDVRNDLLLRRDDGEPLVVTRVSVSGSSVRAEILDPADPAVAAGLAPAVAELSPRPGDRVLRLNIARPETPATGRAVVTLSTDHPRQPEIQIPVQLEVRPLVRVVPAAVHLQPTGDGPHEVFVTLSHGARRTFALEGVRIEGGLEGVSAEVVTPPGPVQRIRVAAAPAPGGAVGIVRGVLVAETGLRRQPTVRVPVTVRPAPGGLGASSP